MKIALITDFWKNSGGGGVKNYVVSLVDALKNKGCGVNVIFRNGHDPEQYCGGRNKLRFSLVCYWQLRRIRPEVVHSHGEWFCLLPGILYKKIHGCIVVHTFHTEPDRKLSYFSKALFQSLLNNCDCVTFVSKRLQERVVEVDALSFPRTAITYAGVRALEVSDEDVERFCKKYGFDDGATVLLAIGMTALPYKARGLKLLIQAVRILRETYPNILLIVTREGKYSEDLKAFAREVGVKEQVVFTGDIYNPYVALKLCDIYTHITLGDGLPLALLEAMAMGMPVVATPIAGIPEVITDGENGLLVAPEVEQIAECISHLLRNREYAEKLGKCAKRTVETKFTWEQSAEKFLSCYSN